MLIIVPIFYNKTIEEGDGSCRLFLLLCNTTTYKGDSSLVSSPFSLQQNHTKRQQLIIIVFFFFNTKKKGIVVATIAFFVAMEPKKK